MFLKNKKGFIALISVLMVSSLLLVSTVAAFGLLKDYQYYVTSVIYSLQTKLVAYSCLQKVALRVGEDPSFDQSNTSFVIAEGDCEVTSFIGDSESRNVTVKGSYKGHVYYLVANIVISDGQIILKLKYV